MSPPLPTNPVWWGWMHAISSYRGNRPTNTQTQPQIHRQDQLQYTVVPQVAGRSISQCLSIIYITKYWFLITFCFLGGGAYISGYAVAICILFRSVFFILLYIKTCLKKYVPRWFLWQLRQIRISFHTFSLLNSERICGKRMD